MNRSLLIVMILVVAVAAVAFAINGKFGFEGRGIAAMKSSLDAGSRGNNLLFGAQINGGGDETTPAEDEDPGAEAGEGGASEDEVAGNDESGEDEEAVEGEDGGAGDEEAGEDEGVEGEEGAGDEEAAADEEAAEGEEAAEDEAAEEEVVDDPVENFKNLDPRDIIIMKYEDLESRKTEPWDEESEDFIPNTGRSDPLTRVRSAVPDELKPPRAGETDMNEINTYLVAAQASMIVDAISSSLQCHNVIQIGLSKYANFSFSGSQPTALQEGQSFGFQADVVNGIPIIATVTVASISTSQVTMSITAAGQGTTTSVTKNKVFIPSRYY